MATKATKAQFTDTAGNPLTLAMLLTATEEQDAYGDNPATGRHGYNHVVVARLVALRNTWDVNYLSSDEHAGLADLEMRALQSTTNDLTPAPADVYGQFLGYRDVYTVGLARAEGMAAMLRALAKAEDRAVAEDGCPLDWPEAVRRTAKALGITQIVFLAQPGRHAEYVYLSLVDGIGHIRTMLGGWRTLERRQLHEWLRPTRPCRVCGNLIETLRVTSDYDVICYPCSDREWHQQRLARQAADETRELIVRARQQTQTETDPTTATDAA